MCKVCDKLAPVMAELFPAKSHPQYHERHWTVTLSAVPQLSIAIDGKHSHPLTQPTVFDRHHWFVLIYNPDRNAW